MKKLWGTERVGPHIYILCRVELDDGRRGGSQRCVGYWQWCAMNEASQKAYLVRGIEVMNADIERLL